MSKYLDEICTRCGSKKIVSRTWKETIETFAGTSEIEISQIVCTNQECQGVFEENLAKETIRQQEVKKKKAEQLEARKESALRGIIEKRNQKLKAA